MSSGAWQVRCVFAIAIVALTPPGMAADVPDSEVYALYRDSVVIGISKVHVATFDTSEGRDYNRENCMVARELFQRQEGVRVNYWCEPGRAKQVVQ